MNNYKEYKDLKNKINILSSKITQLENNQQPNDRPLFFGSGSTTHVSGSKIITGSGVPSNDIGKNGDFYLDSLSGNYYSKIKNVWIIKGNLAGPAGSTGPTGSTGSTGPTGPTGPSSRQPKDLTSDDYSYINIVDTIPISFETGLIINEQIHLGKVFTSAYVIINNGQREIPLPETPAGPVFTINGIGLSGQQQFGLNENFDAVQYYVTTDYNQSKKLYAFSYEGDPNISPPPTINDSLYKTYTQLGSVQHYMSGVYAAINLSPSTDPYGVVFNVQKQSQLSAQPAPIIIQAIYLDNTNPLESVLKMDLRVLTVTAPFNGTIEPYNVYVIKS